MKEELGTEKGGGGNSEGPIRGSTERQPLGGILTTSQTAAAAHLSAEPPRREEAGRDRLCRKMKGLCLNFVGGVNTS